MEGGLYDLFGYGSYKLTGTPIIQAEYVKGLSGNVLGQEDPRSLIVVLTAPSANRVTGHEVIHRLGLGHSGYQDSVMFTYALGDPSGKPKLRPEEIRNLIMRYPQKKR
jgi:hypothetical protein